VFPQGFDLKLKIESAGGDARWLNNNAGRATVDGETKSVGPGTWGVFEEETRDYQQAFYNNAAL
jgi:hypothetical protein